MEEAGSTRKTFFRTKTVLNETKSVLVPTHYLSFKMRRTSTEELDNGGTFNRWAFVPSITPKTIEKMRYPKPQQGEKWKSDLIKRKEAQQLSAYTRIRKLKPRHALWEHPHEQGQAIISH